MLSKCWSDLLNLVAAVLSLLGSGAGTIALWLAPDPTALTKAAAVGATIATLGALAWVISAVLAFIDCMERTGAQAEELKDLKEQVKKLQERVKELEGH